MIPFLDFSGGNCQDARILEDDCAITVKLIGAWEGAKLWRNNQNEPLKCQGNLQVRGRPNIK